MKKQVHSITASLLTFVLLTLPAGAAVDLANPDAVLPVDIVIDQDAKEIRKVYDLSPNTDPAALPMEMFERDGVSYTCTDILRDVIIGSETQNIVQTETVESKDQAMETILNLLPEEKEVTTEDGFSGTLRLDIGSIRTEPSGYGSSSQAVTATRRYPNLAGADANHIPKTITEGGRTLTLQNIQWQTDNTYNADDYEIGDRYTAVCTYGGTKSVSYVTGYTTTANYTGEAYRTGVTVIRYTVIFTALSPAVPEPEPEMERTIPGWAAMIFPVIAALGIGAGGTYFLIKRRESIDETTSYDSRASADDGPDDDDPGSGGGLPDHGAG